MSHTGVYRLYIRLKTPPTQYVGEIFIDLTPLNTALYILYVHFFMIWHICKLRLMETYPPWLIKSILFNYQNSQWRHCNMSYQVCIRWNSGYFNLVSVVLYHHRSMLRFQHPSFQLMLPDKRETPRKKPRIFYYVALAGSEWVIVGISYLNCFLLSGAR